ncbi:MAG: sulfonate ABC transporter substrate-binding protein, partial [Micrococcaceae bacterium]|nr:sulfonate ABC transporter substrate-binding protein [Micrococcaceae bacterium]
PSTVLVVDADFAAMHPDTVTALVAGNAEAVSWLQEADAAERAETINAGIEDAAGARLPDEVLARALDTTDFTTDPFPGAFDRLLEQGVAAGVTRDGSLDGLFDPDTTPPKGTRR